MNKPLFWVALLCFVMGGTLFLLAYRRMQPPVREVGSVQTVDTSYRRIPADASQKWLTEYTLTDASGHQFHSQDLTGQVHVVSFFYATCPGICLRMNSKKAEIAKEFGPQGVKFVSISVDPEVDTPDKLRDYANGLNADRNDWVFLTGDQTYITRVGGEVYGVSAQRQTHVERFLVFDKWGKKRGEYNWSKPVETTEMKLLLTKLLAETEAPPEEPKKLERRKRTEEDEDITESKDAEKSKSPAIVNEPSAKDS
jgi:cytochrome oxidase Cu insertion factor (SCO1/SenC/PrrC family)